MASSQQDSNVYVQQKSQPLISNPVGVNVEVDNEYSDNDSSYGDEFDSSTTSVTSSVFSYTYANGRRYHSDRYHKADYFLPNDDREQDRLDLYHHLFNLILGGRLYTAPLKKVHRVLDVGCGTGIWCVDMAQEHPEAEVTGTDISPIQPAMVPQNCKFEVDDMEEEWTYPKDHFDYIHMRSLCGSFADWDNMIRQAFNHLQPGGILEYQDYGFESFFNDGRPTTGQATPLGQWMDVMTEGAAKLGRPLPVAKTIKDRMLKAGFIDVHQQVAIWPIGEWPKDKDLKTIGKWSKIGLMDSLEAFGIPLCTRGLGWSVNEAKQLCDEVVKDVSKGSKNKYYYHAWFIWGRKPHAK